MENKKTKIISVASIIALALTLVTATFAYFMAQTGEGKSTDIKINASTVDTFTFATGSALSLNLNQDNFASGAGNQTGSTFAKAMLTANNKTNTVTEHYYLYLSIYENTFTYTQDTNTPEILLTIKDASNNEITSITGLEHKTVTDGKGTSISGFDITTKSGLITLFDNREITTTSTKTEQWNVTLTFVNYEFNQASNGGKSFRAKLMIQKEEIPLLTDYVISQYTGTQGNNGIYYHDSSLTNGAGDNSYRYAGANPNNFVCYGTDSSLCQTDDLYRIIGVIDGKVKLIKYDYMTIEQLGKIVDEEDVDGKYDWGNTYYKGSNYDNIASYYWNNSGFNKWSKSQLNKTNLNINFINYLGTTWSNKIATTTWKVGGNTEANIRLKTPSVTYTNEVTSPAESTTYDAKIGLMYVSDYYYAASPSAWTLIGYNSSDATKDYRAAISINWMYMGIKEWTITRGSDTNEGAIYINDNGFVGGGLVYDTKGVRVAFNLEPTVTYVSGTGTKSDPIIIN